MSTQRIRDYIVDHWPNVATYATLFAVLTGAAVWQLNASPAGYSDAEVHTYQAAQNVHGLLDNPLNAPFLLAVKVLNLVHPNSYLPVRIVAVLGGLAVLAILARLLHRWQDMRTAVIGTLLFGISAWFLHVSRYGTPEVLGFGLFVLAACGVWAKQTMSWLALAACFLLAAALLYVPGMVWFIALGIAWQWRTVDTLFKKHLLTVTLAGLAWAALLAPLGWAMFKHHNLILTFLGLPSHVPNPIDVVVNIIKFPFHLLIHAPTNPALWLGNAPILDAFSTLTFLLGGYLYLRHARLGRTPIFASVIVLTVLLTAVGSPISLSVIMPFMYVLVAIGTSYLLDVWFKTFPRNPIARSIGWACLGALLALVCFYQVTHYFVGWPHAQATHDTFTNTFQK